MSTTSIPYKDFGHVPKQVKVEDGPVHATICTVESDSRSSTSAAVTSVASVTSRLDELDERERQQLDERKMNAKRSPRRVLFGGGRHL